MASKVTNQQQGWSSQEANMANTYKNIANMLPTIRQYMLGHVENVKNGNGIITLGDFQEAFTQLETMINDRLRSSFNSRVSITLSNTQTQNSNGVAQQNIQRESKSLKGKKRLTESQLNRVIKESMKRVLKEVKVLGKIADFDRYKSYADDSTRLERIRNFTPNETTTKTEEESTDNERDYYQNIAQQLKAPLRITNRNKYKEIWDELKDYIDNYREDLKMEYEEYLSDIYMTCKTWEANLNNRTVMLYCEKDEPNNAKFIPTMYDYCITQIKHGR